jgi:lipopolysaccharide heptosyltransferase II
MADQYKRILIVDMARLGDVTLSTPVIANLRNNHPDAVIEFLVSRTGLANVKNNPKLNEVHIFEKPEGGFFQQWGAINRISRILKSKKFDVAFLLHRSFTAAIIAYKSGIPKRIGHNTQGRGFLLSQRVELDKTAHRLDNNLRLLQSAGEKITTTRLEYYPASETSDVVKQVVKFRIDKKLVVINPNGVWETKRWETTKFADLAGRIIRKHSTAIVIIGGPGDESRGSIVSGEGENILDLTAKTSVDDMYNICRLSDLVITNDSGPMHIAAAADARIIAIFGPTDPAQCGPRNDRSIVVTPDVPCLRCYKKKCETLECMKSLSVERIMEEVDKVLSS